MKWFERAAVNTAYLILGAYALIRWWERGR